MEFPGVLKKQQVDFTGVNYKRRGISRGDQEKIMLLDFPGVLVLGLKFSKRF